MILISEVVTASDRQSNDLHDLLLATSTRISAGPEIRTAVLNNDLAGHFRRWYPAFTHPGGPAEIEVDLAA